MPKPFSSSVEVRFINRDAVVEDLRRAAAQARASHPEIQRVLLFGSLVRGNWTADSDADLIVVVDRDFPDWLERSRYQIHSKLIHTDTLVYSQAEFDSLARTPGSFLAENLPFSLEL
jgi:predicted nucleotidyltransferase